MFNVPRILIAGTHSDVGKTTLAVGIMGALKKMGYRVQAFKVGPDYIDPSYHSSVLGRPSRNLDSWMVPPEGLLEVYERCSGDSDIAIIEGVMGLFDGAGALEETGSSSQMAKLLKCPVVLVLDVHGMARTAAALVMGYKSFDRTLNLSGVILNKVGSERHAKLCSEAIESATGVPVLGYLPADKELELPQRHLGLIPTHEGASPDSVLGKIVSFVEEHIDLDRVVSISRSSEPLPEISGRIYPKEDCPKRVRIAVAFDRAFNFYYQDNLDILRAYGADIRLFSPVSDKEVPRDIDGLYVGGGFPEVLPRELEGNESMRRSVKKAAEDEMPLYAECGGLMYLTNSIRDFDGRAHSMVGLLHCKTVMTRKLTLNYTLAKVMSDNLLSWKGSSLRGHEFHYSTITEVPEDASFAYSMDRGLGIHEKHDGWMVHETLASYMHLHFAYDQRLARRFLEACERYRRL